MPKYYGIHNKAWNEYPLTVLSWAHLQSDTWEGKTETHIDKVRPMGEHTEKDRPSGTHTEKTRPVES